MDDSSHPDRSDKAVVGGELIAAPVEPAGLFGHSELFAGVRQGLVIGTAILVIALPAFHYLKPKVQPGNFNPAVATAQPPRLTPRFAEFGGEPASADAKFVAHWVADSGDNRNLSFVIIDKKNTKVFVFAPDGKLIGATPVLLGMTPGDDSVEGIGKKAMSEVEQQEKTTPAGRFMGEPGRNLTGEDVVWVDYDAAVSMHRVRLVDPKERRLERLATPTSADNRISYGCVNVPIEFFENVLSPQFKSRYGVVYVLPEVKTVREVFTAAYDPAQKYGVAKNTPSPATQLNKQM
ncbi:MAG: hypothetical protein V4614_17040 [Pseudomonadota bacterium]